MASKGAGMACVLATLVGAVAAEPGTVTKLELEKGYSSYNTIGEPVFAAPSGVSVVFGAVESAYDRQGQILRQLSKGMFTRGVRADVDPSIDLGVLLAQALRTEAATMGLPVGEGGSAWEVSGKLDDVFLESKQIPYGATLFYAYMDVSLRVRRSGSDVGELRLRLHNYFRGVNLGFSRKDEAADALMRFFVESAQEIVARLNRTFFHVPPATALRAKAEALGQATELPRGDVRLIGLSGDASVVPVLLELLPRLASVGDRAEIIVALANLGSPVALETLAARYADEDEDCRFYTLKAFDYIGGERAAALVREKGLGDEDAGCRSLAERLSK